MPPDTCLMYVHPLQRSWCCKLASGSLQEEPHLEPNRWMPQHMGLPASTEAVMRSAEDMGQAHGRAAASPYPSFQSMERPRLVTQASKVREIAEPAALVLEQCGVGRL